MNILSLQLLYKESTPQQVYEAFWVNNGVATKLGDITDLSKTFASAYSSACYVFDGDLYYNIERITTGRNISCFTGLLTAASVYSYFIEEGKLYWVNRANGQSTITQIGSDSDWLKLTGYSSGANCVIAEKSDGLYSISNMTVAQISTLTGWSKIVGSANTGSANYYGYGIKDGKLYYIYANGDGVVQKGSDTTWSDISGYGNIFSAIYCGYGINNGKLYALGTTIAQVGSDTNWSKISGVSYSPSNVSNRGCGFGIKADGKLYTLFETTATQVGSSADWQNCSGKASSSNKGLIYDSTSLYSIMFDRTTTKLLDGDFVYCDGDFGTNSTTGAYAIAIRRK